MVVAGAEPVVPARTVGGVARLRLTRRLLVPGPVVAARTVIVGDVVARAIGVRAIVAAGPGRGVGASVRPPLVRAPGRTGRLAAVVRLLRWLPGGLLAFGGLPSGLLGRGPPGLLGRSGRLLGHGGSSFLVSRSHTGVGTSGASGEMTEQTNLRRLGVRWAGGRVASDARSEGGSAGGRCGVGFVQHSRMRCAVGAAMRRRTDRRSLPVRGTVSDDLPAA
ncbi:hypothetical protein BN12_1310003 [Nostocoides japonicum T1-X7]|uniref:Uncharacterized protein n=1 Tax=Nostocoides japonicum T1-X7 TaxID=1194083 RepID=A0A077LUW9_9MICO|nr:hypothetical protein BN12_1310003 [Tetrasphaera japonica T1-X7]